MSNSSQSDEKGGHEVAPQKHLKGKEGEKGGGENIEGIWYGDDN